MLSNKGDNTRLFLLKNLVLAGFFFFQICISPTAQSSIDFNKLEFHEDHPRTYTLFSVDTSLVASAKKEDWPSVCSKVYEYLNRHILENKKEIFFSTDKKKKRPKEYSWIKVTSKKDQPFIVQLLKMSHDTRVETLMDHLTSDSKREGFFSLTASLIIIPQKDSKAMVYGFGCWKSLLNPSIIIPQWGLRLLSSTDLFNPKSVKEVSSKHYRKATPSTRKERSSGLSRIETFDVEVGSEGLEVLRAIPKGKYSTKHVSKGADYYQFDVNPSDTDDHSKSLDSLERVAKIFFDLTEHKEFSMHSDLRVFVDERVKDDGVIDALNKSLVGIVTGKNPEYLVFIHSGVWSDYGYGKKCLFGDDKIDSAWQAFNIKGFTLNTPIMVTPSSNLKVSYLSPAGRLLFSLPIEHEKRFYRFERGSWFEVDKSRFGAIKRVLRNVKIPGGDLDLPDYVYGDTKIIAGKEKSYKEINYNRRAVLSLNTQGHKAALLDTLNVPLETTGGGHLFEFADILLQRNKKFYIIHVKRAEASALSHHREQVERSADYLSSLLKEGAQNLFLKAAVNDLYRRHGISTNKVPKRLTHGNIFIDVKTKTGKQNSLETSVLNVLKKDAKSQLGRFKTVIKTNVDLDFFKDHRAEFYVAMNAIYDCIGTINLSEEEDNKTTIIKDFFDSVRQTIEAREIMFLKGHLKKEDREKITIVLAVIDDRRVDELRKPFKPTIQKVELLKKSKKQDSAKIKKAEDELKALEDKLDLTDIVKKDKKHPIFSDQDLWGLDRTRALVQKNGFNFNIVVLNEYVTPDWDAFGEISVKPSKPDVSDEDSSKDDSDGSTTEPETEDSSDSKDKDQYLKKIFDSAKLPNLGKNLDTETHQKLTYANPNPVLGLYASYVTCPTRGDGNCFFHAAFTEYGEDRATVVGKASIMRKDFCDSVQTGNYLDDCRPLLYEHYKTLYSDEHFDQIPQAILNMFHDNGLYDRTKNYLTSRAIPIPAALTLPHEENAIRAAITDAEVKDYMEDLRTSTGDFKTFIPFRPDMRCPAQILAEKNNKKINIFTYNKQTRALSLVKTVGNGSIVNILHAGNHYVRLYNSAESVPHKLSATQVVKNS